MIFAQADTLITKGFEFWGPWGFVVAILIAIIVWLARRNKRLEDEREAILEKNISALLQSQQAMEASQITVKEQTRELKELHNLVLQNGCKWQGR